MNLPVCDCDKYTCYAYYHYHCLLPRPKSSSLAMDNHPMFERVLFDVSVCVMSVTGVGGSISRVTMMMMVAMLYSNMSCSHMTSDRA